MTGYCAGQSLPAKASQRWSGPGPCGQVAEANGTRHHHGVFIPRSRSAARVHRPHPHRQPTTPPPRRQRFMPITTTPTGRTGPQPKTTRRQDPRRDRRRQPPRSQKRPARRPPPRVFAGRLCDRIFGIHKGDARAEYTAWQPCSRCRPNLARRRACGDRLLRPPPLSALMAVQWQYQSACPFELQARSGLWPCGQAAVVIFD